MTSISIKYFPFSPNIPWKIKHNKYIEPEISLENWKKALDNKNIVVTSFGGLFESFFSLSIVEAINKLEPSKYISWLGDNKFAPIINFNGIAKNAINQDIDKNISSLYPAPLFFDKNDNVYFNCLNNYINVFSYNKKYNYRSKTNLCKQIFKNSLLEWNKKYIPSLINLKTPELFNNLEKIRKFNYKKPYVLLCPDNMGWSIHKKNCLNWSINEIRSFISMLNSENIKSIIMTNTNKYYGINATTIEPRLDYLFWLLINSSAVLSQDIDILLIGMMVSKGKIFGIKHKYEYNLRSNRNYLGLDSFVFIDKKLKPLDIYQKIRQK